ncbi:MAG: mycothiol synthase, partial [Actinomycetota bacterium]|nr:mycothiol synthase [Actinomycetota bacterium]
LVSRAATDDDLPALVALQQSWDTRWFGAPEHDESEVRESLARVDPREQRSVVVFAGGRLAGAGWWWGDDTTLLADPTALLVDPTALLVDPTADTTTIHDELVSWLVTSGSGHAEALSRDTSLRAALEAHGWEHWLSQFELLRDTAGLPDPAWPDGVTATALGDGAEAAYRVIYDEAGWADVPGHGRRDFTEWHGLFVAGEDPEQQVLAWQGERLVGVALGKVFSDGTGWVSQVAVPRDQQGRGLGSALLAEAFGRRVAAGATQLGLGVSAANTDALRLYRSLGLDVDREWMRYRPTGSTAVRTRRGRGTRPGCGAPSCPAP